jgi:pimeloyl-ACP methyl ester carboxylesterase
MSDIQTFDPEGRAIPYAAEGKGPAVVLVADRGETIGSLAALAHSVAQEDFRVVRIGSSGGAEAASADLAQDVLAILDELGIDHAWVGGHGFGGSVARVVSAEHHERVNGLLLLGVEGGEQAALAPHIPVLVIQGTDDDVTPPANGDALRASAPELVSVVAVEGGGHRFPATHVGATSWALEDYLDWD